MPKSLICCRVLEQQFPNSALVSDAYLESANTYLANEDYRAAITPLTKLVTNKQAAALHPQGYLKLGVAYFNLDDNQNALASFKTLIATYPNSIESDAAVEYVRDIFVAQQKPGEFADFMRQNGKSISYSEEDSLTFASADLRFNNNEMQNALSGFKDYLNKFPNGRNAIEANYKIAEIYNSRKEFDKCLDRLYLCSSKSPK